MRTQGWNGRRAPDLFFVALCLLLPLIVVGEINLTVAGVDLRLHYKVVLRGIAIAWVVLQLLPRTRTILPYRAGLADLPLGLFAAAVIASVALSGSHWGTVRTLLGSIGLGLLARALFDAPERRWWFVHYLGAAVVLIVGYELIMVPNLLPPFQSGRYRLLTANPNVLGFAFAMVAPLLTADALARTGRRRVIVLVYLAVALLGALLTFSRAAAIGLVVGGCTLALCEHRRWRALLVGGLAAVLFLALLRPDVWIPDRAAGDRDRLRIIHTSLTLAAESPVLGVGFGIKNLEDHFPDRYAALYGSRLFRFHSANQLVDLLVGTGLVGTGLALWWWVRLVRGVAGQRRRHAGAARRRAAGNLATLAAISVMSMAEPPLYHGKLLPLLFLLLGYVELDPLDEHGADQADDGLSRG